MKIKAQSICVNIILADREAKVGPYPSRANTDATTFSVLTESNTFLTLKEFHSIESLYPTPPSEPGDGARHCRRVSRCQCV